MNDVQYLLCVLKAHHHDIFGSKRATSIVARPPIGSSRESLYITPNFALLGGTEM